MSDKKGPKPSGQDKTQSGVLAMMEWCESKTDASSARISAAIVADNLADGKKGVAALGATRLSENVGKCVADGYSDKQPSVLNRMSSGFTNLTNTFSNVAATVKEDAKLVGGQMVMSGVGAVTNDTPNIIRERQARTQAASAGIGGSGP